MPHCHRGWNGTQRKSWKSVENAMATNAKCANVLRIFLRLRSRKVFEWQGFSINGALMSGGALALSEVLGSKPQRMGWSERADLQRASVESAFGRITRSVMATMGSPYIHCNLGEKAD